MSTPIISGFHLNSDQPIENRLVIGSQSIHSYPAPFYAFRDDIIYKYPGLRIWDFNDNVPYVWNGIEWINENTTGAIVQNAATGNTGFRNFLTKFENNTTLLTKSLLFDTGSNLGLGLTGSAITPNSVISNTNGTPTTIVNPPNTQSPYKQGIHVAGNIKTNQYFSGDGRYIINLNAYNITSGLLRLDRIAPPPDAQPELKYMLVHQGTNAWIQPENFLTLTNVGTGVGIYNSSGYELRTFQSQSIDISATTQSVILENKAGVNMLEESEEHYNIYRHNETTKLHEFLALSSESLRLEYEHVDMEDTDSDIVGIRINMIQDENVKQFYVNSNYTSSDRNGSMLKPFTNICEAMNAVIGVGTRYAPEHINARVILQTDSYINDTSFTPFPLLGNRLTVNSVIISSDGKYEIRYTGTVNYIFDLEEIRTGVDPSLPVSMTLNNIHVRTTTKGILKNVILPGAIRPNAFSLYDVKLESVYTGTGAYTQAKTSDGTNITWFGNPVYVQDSIVNDTPVVILKGQDINGNSVLYETGGTLEIQGTSQTILHLENVGISFGDLVLGITDYYRNTQNKSVNGSYAYKNDTKILHVSDDSWVDINSLKFSGQTTIMSTLIGGVENYIYHDNSYLRIRGGFCSGGVAKHFLSASLAGSITMTQLNLTNLRFDPSTPSSIYNRDSATKYIEFENSIIRNMKNIASSKVQIQASSSQINGCLYSSLPSYTDNVEATSGGLIPGNIYVDKDGHVRKLE